jgi:hypothetical protein
MHIVIRISVDCLDLSVSLRKRAMALVTESVWSWEEKRAPTGCNLLELRRDIFLQKQGISCSLHFLHCSKLLSFTLCTEIKGPPFRMVVKLEIC